MNGPMPGPGSVRRADATPSDALVVFGFTDDLANKKVFPALFAMVKKGTLTVPVIGVASTRLGDQQVRQRVRDSIELAGVIVVENDLFQIVALLAMEPPAFQRYVAVQSAKASVIRAMRPLEPDDVVRGQYDGYRSEKDVAADSDVETFCALRLFIDSWRWAGVPWYLRAGKLLPSTSVEVLVQMRPPPQRLFDDSAPPQGRANYVSFKLQPASAIALAARVKRPGKEFVGDQRELYLGDDALHEASPYERLLGDAMAGEGALFTNQEAVEAAWVVVDPVFANHHAALPYQPGTWGPEAADALIAGDGVWHNPVPEVRTP